MAEMKDIVKLAVDAYKGSVEKYSQGQSQEALRQALIELNGGSTKLNYRNIRDGKCAGMFTLIEEILAKTVVEGLQDDDFFVNLVDFRNVAEGDSPVFVIEDSILFTVDDTADGTQAVRRQRIAGESEVTIKTVMKTVRIYEELNRILAGRVDFNHLIDVVAESFKQKLLNDVYTMWHGVTAAQLGGSDYCSAGTYDEDDVLDIIEHVEAAAGGRPVTILGTKKAVRNLAMSIMSDSAKDDLYNMGYYGRFFGSPVIVLPQRHKVGTTTFVFDDDVLTFVAGDAKPIKCVYEGDPLMIMGDPLHNMDLTQEYFYGEKYGLGLVMAQNTGIGRFTIEH